MFIARFPWIFVRSYKKTKKIVLKILNFEILANLRAQNQSFGTYKFLFSCNTKKHILHVLGRFLPFWILNISSCKHIVHSRMVKSFILFIQMYYYKFWPIFYLSLP